MGLRTKSGYMICHLLHYDYVNILHLQNYGLQNNDPEVIVLHV